MLSMHRLHTARWRSGRIRRIALVGVVAALLTACSSGRVFQRGSQAAMTGDWDTAVSYYAEAVKAEPNRVDYRMALERAQMSASQIHFDKARDLERRDQLDAALTEYRKVVEYHPGHQEARAKVTAIEQTIRGRVEASRPRPAIEAMREQARKPPAEPLLNPKSRELIDFKSAPGANLRDTLSGMGAVAGITVNFDVGFTDKPYGVDLKDISFEQALDQVVAANQLFYKVLGDRSIIVIPDTQPKRQAYEEQAVQTYFLSHADAGDLATLINSVMRVTQAIPPVVQAGKGTNTILARASVPMLQIIERIVLANDKPRAEIVIDVEILEVNRNRAKQYGIELSQYALGLTMSPESAPSTTTGGTAATTGTGGFNLNTISKGVSTNDFYATVPSALIKFLESDINTKVIAKPQLRGTEGETLSLNLGEELPVPSTTFSSYSAGGVNTVPMTSFQYKPVGVNMEIKPRVTYEGDVTLELKLEVSAQGPDKNIAGQNLPSFTSRKVGTKLRLRDGESNLLAGLLREDERTSLKGCTFRSCRSCSPPTTTPWRRPISSCCSRRTSCGRTS
jgi:general secretion pathway protein D